MLLFIIIDCRNDSSLHGVFIVHEDVHFPNISSFFAHVAQRNSIDVYTKCSAAFEVQCEENGRNFDGGFD